MKAHEPPSIANLVRVRARVRARARARG